MTKINCRFLVPLEFRGGPSLCNRIRGCWGNRLRTYVESGNVEAEQLLAACFTTEDSQIRPYCIHAKLVDQHLNASLILLGRAGQWRNTAFDSFVGSIMEGDGLALTGMRKSKRRPLRLISAEWQREEGIDTNFDNKIRIMDFISPLKLGPKNVIGTHFPDIFTSITRRVQSLAKWSGFQLIDDVDSVRMAAAHAELDGSSMQPHIWHRWSSRQGRMFEMPGLLGRLRVENNNPSINRLINFGEIIGTGGGVSQGMGRYET